MVSWVIRPTTCFRKQLPGEEMSPAVSVSVYVADVKINNESKEF